MGNRFLHEIKWQMFGKRTSADTKRTHTNITNSTQRKNQTQWEKESAASRRLHAWCSKICHLKISIVDLHANRLRHSWNKNKNIIKAKCAHRMCVAESVTSPRLRPNWQTEEDVRYSNFVGIFNLSSMLCLTLSFVHLLLFIFFARVSNRLFPNGIHTSIVIYFRAIFICQLFFLSIRWWAKRTTKNKIIN